MSAVAGRAPIIERDPVPLADTELTARLFRALGDATRLRIVELLVAEGELHQAEIVDALGLSQGRASEHLACLTWCGFVSSRPDGRRTYYRLIDPAVSAIVGLGTEMLERNQAGIASCRRIDDDRYHI